MMKYEGLRDWLSIIEQRGELTMLEDVDWNLEQLVSTYESTAAPSCAHSTKSPKTRW
ncbi:MAG: hypothetical protein ACTHLX_15315 [Candidatus Binatia bacterium]